MPTIPSYLTSGASSRAHHAFLVKLHRAESEQEEDEVIDQELSRAKKELGVKGGASLNTIVETLIIILHCDIQRNRTPTPEKEIGREEDWALIAALQVVERGRDVREKRIGYLFLSERLPARHELRLMLINTIRKDLDSFTIAYMILALNMIVKQPSTDLAPAVSPILTSKAYLKHPEPAVRQKTLEALAALHLSIGKGREFSLSTSKVVRMLVGEEDLGVKNVLLRTMRLMIESGAHVINTSDERAYLLHQVSVVLRKCQVGSPVSLEAVRTIRLLMNTGDGARQAAEVVDETDGVLGQIVSDIRCASDGAFLLEICKLISEQPILTIATQTSLGQVISLLRPKTSSSTTLPPPNDHILVLRCLALLPSSSWDGMLGEEEMGTIMQGLESGDDGVRQATLRLLNSSAPQLLDQSFSNYLTSLKSRSDLILPVVLQPNTSGKETTQAGLHETANRALEVVEIQCHDVDGVGAAEKVYAILEALCGADEDVFWVVGSRSILDHLEHASQAYQKEFSAHLLRLPAVRSQTLQTIRAAVSCQYLEVSGEEAESAAQALLQDLASAEGSDVQEIILAGVVAITSSSDNAGAVGAVQLKMEDMLREKMLSKYIRSRMDMILDLIQAGDLGQIRSETGGRNLQDVLQAIQVVHKRHHSTLISPGISSLNLPPPPRSAGLLSSELRYNAFDPPNKEREGQGVMG